MHKNLTCIYRAAVQKGHIFWFPWVPFIYRWDCILIDCLLFNGQWQIFHAYAGHKQVKQYKQNKWRRNGKTGSVTFDCHWITMEHWLATRYLVFYGDYTVPTLFRNLQKRSLVCREHGTHQICYPLWSMTSLSLL